MNTSQQSSSSSLDITTLLPAQQSDDTPLIINTEQYRQTATWRVYTALLIMATLIITTVVTVTRIDANQQKTVIVVSIDGCADYYTRMVTCNRSNATKERH